MVTEDVMFFTLYYSSRISNECYIIVPEKSQKSKSCFFIGVTANGWLLFTKKGGWGGGVGVDG
jgi:hypothetical protein